jgi:hypothetical protein
MSHSTLPFVSVIMPIRNEPESDPGVVGFPP